MLSWLRLVACCPIPLSHFGGLHQSASDLSGFPDGERFIRVKLTHGHFALDGAVRVLYPATPHSDRGAPAVNQVTRTSQYWYGCAVFKSSQPCTVLAPDGIGTIELELVVVVMGRFLST